MLETLRNLAIQLAIELDLHYEDDEREIADSIRWLKKAAEFMHPVPEEVQHTLRRFHAAQHQGYQ